MPRALSYNAWLKKHQADYAEGCTCEVCMAIAYEDRPRLRMEWFRWMDAARLRELPADRLLQRELELDPGKTNWGMF